VTLVGVGGGVAYGYLGLTHHAIDDLAAMRALPNMTVLAPCDPRDAEAAHGGGPGARRTVYLRLGKNGEPALLSEGTSFAIGRAIAVRDGADITIASTGPILAEALAAAERLADQGIDAAVLHFGPSSRSTPVPSSARSSAPDDPHPRGAQRRRRLRRRGCRGGRRGRHRPRAARRFPETFIHEVGSREHLLAHYGLDAAGVAARAAAAVDIAPSPRRLTLQRGTA
jgi:transketolase